MTPTEAIIDRFLQENDQYSEVVFDKDDGITVYFKNADEPFVVTEFIRGSDTRNLLEKLEADLFAVLV